MFAYLKSTLHV